MVVVCSGRSLMFMFCLLRHLIPLFYVPTIYWHERAHFNLTGGSQGLLGVGLGYLGNFYQHVCSHSSNCI